MDSLSFSGFPEDVQLCILSFLTPSELAAFACTSKGFVSLCRCDAKVWFSLCDRRWGSKTHISKWGNGKIAYKQLYQTLTEYENLIGFWSKSGQSNNGGALNLRPLVFFEWGTSFITASTVYPSMKGTYRVKKAPFLWLSITPDGMPVSFLDPVGSRSELFNDLVNSGVLGFIENGFVPVDVTFMGKTHVVVKENLNFDYSNSLNENNIGTRRIGSSGNLSWGEESEMESGTPQQGTVGSLPDRLVSEIYQYFANRTSPGGSGDRAARRQKRREKERRKLEAEYLVKIVNSSPTPSRPLQGLWKGICDDMNLDFYLITYDDIGKIGCRRIGNSSQLPSGYCPLLDKKHYIY